MMTSRGFLFSISTLLLFFGCSGGSTGSQAKSSSTETQGSASQTVVDPATVGNVAGIVKFSGTKPKLQSISMGADAYCKGQHKAKVLSEEVAVNADGSLKNVLVYVKAGLQGQAPAGNSPVLDQVGCLYVPHVVHVQTGQDLIIRNSDNVLHNVNARPKKNKGFNLGQPVKGMESKKSFDNPEVGIPVKCDVHPWMKSYIAVLSHSYGSVTGDKGSFSLKHLPPGTYEIEAWHERFGTQTQKVTVGASETKTLNFTFSNKGA